MAASYERYVGVAGGSVCSDEIFNLAQETGYSLAKKGAIVVCGGRTGVMEAAAKGAKKAGGKTIGILPGADYSEANKYIDYAICTGIGQARNLLVVLNSRVLVAIGGEGGTLSEIALAMKHDIPVVALRSWPLHEINSGGDLRLFHPVETVEQCIEKVVELLSE
jgi:uncharacterized protein (TIGR00725 family)